MEREVPDSAHALKSRDHIWRMSGSLLVVIVEADTTSVSPQELQKVSKIAFFRCYTECIIIFVCKRLYVLLSIQWASIIYNRESGCPGYVPLFIAQIVYPTGVGYTIYVYCDSTIGSQKLC